MEILQSTDISKTLITKTVPRKEFLKLVEEFLRIFHLLHL